MSDSTQEAKRLLAQLKQRLVAGELDRAEYQAQRELVLGDLTPEERTALATGTPSPQATTPAPGTPPPITPSSLGPSGASGRGLRTAVPSLADLDLRPGTVLLEQWRLVRELGRGGFGAVFEAEELHLHDRQAVKVLDPAMVAKEELLARFRREVSLMRRLVHPRIVRVYDYREDPKQLVALISMELVTGGSVKQLLTLARRKQQPIPMSLALEILHQTLEALAEAHGQGVIHRDVTPGNVLLAGGAPEQLLADPIRDPQVKLVDFGIAGLVERSELSQKSRVLGTAAYVAPEVLDPTAEVTPAADVYGAGAMAYELLTGRLPLGRFAEPGQLRADLPAAINGLVLELLDSDPARRPKPARCARDLPRILEEEARLGAERRKAEERARRDAEDACRRREAELERQRSAEAQREAGRKREAEVARFRAEQERLRRAAEEEREREAPRQREARALEQERAEAERLRLEEWARQQEAARQAKERLQLEAERERHRQATTRRVEAEAAVHARPAKPKKKTVPPLALGAIAAALILGMLLGVRVMSNQRAARDQARAETVRLEQEKQAALATERQRAEQAAEQERQRQSRLHEEERQRAAKAERERSAREQEKARVAEAARQEQVRRAAEAVAQKRREEEARARAQPSGTWWDDRSGLLWAAWDNGRDINWDNAKAYCDSLTLGGFSDWRLPSVDELEGLYDGTSSKKYKTRGKVELTACCSWSSEVWPSDAKPISFVTGGGSPVPRAFASATRALCVRGSGG